MNPPTEFSQYVTSLKEVWWGAALAAVTLIIHAFGMLWTLRSSRALKERFENPPTFARGMSILILTTWMICFVHIVEVMPWAGFFQWKQFFANYSQDTYSAFMEYTTVGSLFNLPLNWRLLEGMIATAGLMGFAWSTGVLLTLARQFQEQQIQLLKEGRAQGKQKPANAGKPGDLR